MKSSPDKPNNSDRIDLHDAPVGITPYRLLWTMAILASGLCIVAFMLWGTHGPVILFDMMMALCT